MSEKVESAFSWFIILFLAVMALSVGIWFLSLIVTAARTLIMWSLPIVLIGFIMYLVITKLSSKE